MISLALFVVIVQAVEKSPVAAASHAVSIVRRRNENFDSDGRRKGRGVGGEVDPEPEWGRVVEAIENTYDSFGSTYPSLQNLRLKVRNTWVGKMMLEPALPEGACDGPEPYLLTYTHATPSLAEFHKMPSDQEAMQNLMGRLALQSTIRVGVLGGSMTFGQHCEDPVYGNGSSCAWPSRLERWLQKTFPHAAVRVINMAVPGMSTLARLLEIQNDLETAQTKHGQIDVWIIDHLINDAYISFHLNNPVLAVGYNGSNGDFLSLATEALILKIRQFDANVGLMMLATGCVNCLAFRENELKIAKHHRIPYVDYSFLVEQRGEECSADEEDLGQASKLKRHCALWNGDTHPTWQGHQQVADTIGYQMGRALCDNGKSHQTKTGRLERITSTFWPTTALRSLAPCKSYLSDWNAARRPEHVLLSRWSLMEDVPGKLGWIANETGARIVFPVSFGKEPTIGINFLRSYEKMGKASIQIVEAGGKLVHVGEINGLWDTEDKRISVTDTKWFSPAQLGATANTMVSLIVDIIDTPAISTDESRKMKILGVVSC
jgi:hypothetical protein